MKNPAELRVLHPGVEASHWAAGDWRVSCSASRSYSRFDSATLVFATLLFPSVLRLCGMLLLVGSLKCLKLFSLSLYQVSRRNPKSHDEKLVITVCPSSTLRKNGEMKTNENVPQLRRGCLPRQHPVSFGLLLSYFSQSIEELKK